MLSTLFIRMLVVLICRQVGSKKLLKLKYTDFMANLSLNSYSSLVKCELRVAMKTILKNVSV